MARERKAVEDMSVEELTLAFGAGLEGNFQNRLNLGKVVHFLLQRLGGIGAVVRHLSNAYPNAEDRFGVKINAYRLTEMLNTWRDFGQNGGITSPDGVHHLSGKEIEALGLTPTEVAKLGELVSAERIKVKDVLRETRRAHGGLQEQNAKKVETARENIRKLMAPPEPSHAEKVAALVQSIKRREDRIVKEQAEIARERAELAELQRVVVRPPQAEEPAVEAEVVANVPEQAELPSVSA